LISSADSFSFGFRLSNVSKAILRFPGYLAENNQFLHFKFKWVTQKGNTWTIEVDFALKYCYSKQLTPKRLYPIAEPKKIGSTDFHKNQQAGIQTG